MDELVVKVKPHIGIKATRFGNRPCKLNQSRIFINGLLAGYVSDKPGSLIRLRTNEFGEDDLAEIKSKVDAIRGNVSCGIHSLTNIAQNTFTVVLEESESTELDI